MAKISARGATELHRLAAASGEGEHTARVLLVLASDGRVLIRATSYGGERVSEAYRVLVRISDPAKRTADMLGKVASRFGYQPESV